jgi:transitional endoplasmic reticulum ATPase
VDPDRQLQTTPLTPVQQAAFDTLQARLAAHHVAILSARPGMGKTQILRALFAKTGGVHLTSRDFVEASTHRDPLSLDETIYGVLHGALETHDTVIVDDFHFVSAACGAPMYPRQSFLAAALLPLAALARDRGKTLVFTSEGAPLVGLFERCPVVSLGAFTPADYEAICASYLGAVSARRLDYGRIHRFAPKLTARQLHHTCVALRDDDSLETERFVEYLREHHLASNVDVAEVQVVQLTDLKGIDEVLEALEANVILPLENVEVSQELGLQPKRGVLLAGPPGTGKTTIGRALSRRLRSKFFLLDGTTISGTPDFFPRVQRIFEAARQNAPCIIFIDDSDVIFESGYDAGLYRYLLTMLDGLESASASRICLMMTAMDVGNLPPALVRSGRIELWLEMRLPAAPARADILRDLCASLPAALGDVDIDAIAAAGDGLSGADLRRVVEDGKLLFAFERTKRGQTQPATMYFLAAMDTVRRNQQQYAEAEARARARRSDRPAFFDPMSALAAMAMEQGLAQDMGSATFPVGLSVSIGSEEPSPPDENQ